MLDFLTDLQMLWQSSQCLVECDQAHIHLETQL